MIGSKTRYIISTSGRLSSIQRYNNLLQKLLGVDIAYIPINPYPDELKIDPENFASAIRGMGAIGGAISKDIKIEIIPFLDELHESATQVMSANTIIREGKRLIGYNTDIYGFKKAMEYCMKRVTYNIKRAVVYGYGGIFNVIFHVLNSMGVEVTITGRKQDAVEKKCKEFNLAPYHCIGNDLFINAAPVSDLPLKSIVGFIDAINDCKTVFDYHMPGELLKEFCLKTNRLYISGAEMYYPQMYKQWELFLKGIVQKEKIPALILMAENLCSKQE